MYVNEEESGREDAAPVTPQSENREKRGKKTEKKKVAWHELKGTCSHEKCISGFLIIDF